MPIHTTQPTHISKDCDKMRTRGTRTAVPDGSRKLIDPHRKTSIKHMRQLKHNDPETSTLTLCIMTKKHHKRSSKHQRREKSKRAKTSRQEQEDDPFERTYEPSKGNLKPPPVQQDQEKLSDTGDTNSDAGRINETPRRSFVETIRTLTKIGNNPNKSPKPKPIETMAGSDDQEYPKEQDEDIEDFSSSEDDRKLPGTRSRLASSPEESLSHGSDAEPQVNEDSLPDEVPATPPAAGIVQPELIKRGRPHVSDKERLEEMLRTNGFVAADEGEISGIETSPAKEPYEELPMVETCMDIVDFGEGNARFGIMFRNSNNRRRHQVHVVDKGSQFVTNEPGNKYLMNLMARMTKRVHIAEQTEGHKKPIRTYDTFVGDELIEEICPLSSTYSVSSDVKLTHESRYLKALKKVFNQFVQPRHKRNGYMAQMAYMYACARTGNPGPFRGIGDEYHAAVRAMRTTMMPLTDRHYWEMTNIIAGWEMILLQVLHGHLEHHGLPGFLFGHGGSDSKDRKERSRLVKVKQDDTPVPRFSRVKDGYEMFHIANNVSDLTKLRQYIRAYEANKLKFVNLKELRLVGKDPIAVYEARARRKSDIAKQKKSPTYDLRSGKRKSPESTSFIDDEESDKEDEESDKED